MDIVESCEITTTVAPSHLPDKIVVVKIRYVIQPDMTDICMGSPCLFINTTVVIVLSIFLIIFCIYSVIFCIEMVELRTIASTDIVSGNVYSIIYVD